MSYFSKEFIKFFKSLSKNNNREWFNANKSVYEKEVKEPFYNLVAELLTLISFEDQTIISEPADCIFRIYRDIRFSKDKTPYKTYSSALVSSGGRKALNDPGFYFELSHKGIDVYSGLYNVEKDGLAKIRRYISDNSKELYKIINSKKFTQKFGSEILGDKSKRLPPEFAEAAKLNPVIFNTQFYVNAKLDPELILSSELANHLYDYYQAGVHLSNYIKRALK